MRPAPFASSLVAILTPLTLAHAPLAAQVGPGQAVVTVATGVAPSQVGEMYIVDFATRTATQLSIPPALQTGITNCVNMSPGGGVAGYVGTAGLSAATPIAGDVFSISIVGTTVTATQLNATQLPGYNVAQVAPIGGDLWFVTADLATTNGLYGGKLCTVPLAGGPHVVVEDLDMRADWPSATSTINALCNDGPIVYVAVWPAGTVYRRDTTQAAPSTLHATLPLSRTGAGTSTFNPVHAQLVIAGPHAGHIAFVGLYGDVVVLDRTTGALLGHWFDITVTGTGFSAFKNSAIQNPTSGDWITGTRDGHVDTLVPVGGGQRAQRDVAGVGSAVTASQNSVNGIWMDQFPLARGYFAQGAGCAGAGGFIPTSLPRGVPGGGNSGFAFGLDSGVGGAVAVLFFGGTNSAPYPIDLTLFGAPGCFLRNDLLVTVPTALAGSGNGLGSASIPVPLPNVNATVFTQWATQDATYSLGFAFSDGRRLVLP